MRRHTRTRVDIALDQIAAEFTKELDLLALLGTFSDDRHAEAAAERDDALQELARALRVRDAVNEDAIDLQLIERQLGQVAERGIVGPEIIERQRHAKALQGLERGANTAFRMVGQQAFGQFEA